jgi:cytochrome c oxidase cbb3-type subunit 1
MIHDPTSAAPAEVTPGDTHARWPLLLLLGCGLGWLITSGVFALIAASQLHSPAFFADCAWFTHGRMQAMRETAFVYGWLMNTGLAIALWILGRLGGHPLRALNWTLAGTVLWNAAVGLGLAGIATGDMTSFTLLQIPRYVQPLMVFAFAAISIAGVLAWAGRDRDRTFASQWYAVAAVFLFPWLLTAAQALLLWLPVRGVVLTIGAAWYAHGLLTLCLVPLALAGAYYVVPKVTGRSLPAYEAAPVGFWTLVFAGAWTGGKHLVGGPVPAWIATTAVVAAVLLLFHYLVVVLNLRVACGVKSTSLRFVRFGLAAYVLGGLLDASTSLRSVATHTQFTFVSPALELMAQYGGVSMLFFGVVYYLVPRLAGRSWSSAALVSGHTVMAMAGVAGSVVALVVAGWLQGTLAADPAVSFADIHHRLRTPLLLNTAAQFVLLSANLLLLVNFARTVCPGGVGQERVGNRLPPSPTAEARAT